jgi:uncharacterized Rmd1/YagE family protein
VIGTAKVSELKINNTSITVRAVFFGHRITTDWIQREEIIATHPLTIELDQQGYVVIFRYGVVVFINLDEQRQQAWLANAERYIVEPHEEMETETLELLLCDRQEDFNLGRLEINSINVAKMQLIAFVLAKSVVLALYEKNTAGLFDRVEPLARDLQEKGQAYRQDRELLRHIGNVLSTQGKMVGRAEVTEKPELLWEYPELERLFQIMESEYEIRERHLALERKFELISRTATTLLDLLQYKRSLRVEWYIVILIVVDIIISLGEKVIS